MLVVGDAIDFMGELEDRSICTIATDIPYNEVNRKTGGLRIIDKGFADSEPINLPDVVEQFVRISWGHIFVWCGTKQISTLVEEFERWKLTCRVGSWTKTNPSPMNGKKMYLSGKEFCVIARQKKAPFFGHCEVAEWKGPRSKPVKWKYGSFPTPKPVWLMRQQIEVTTPKREIVLDPYMGSGSTGVACVDDYHFVGVDNFEDCVKLAQQRMTDQRLKILKGK